jgi:hypothetical protein
MDQVQAFYLRSAYKLALTVALGRRWSPSRPGYVHPFGLSVRYLPKGLKESRRMARKGGLVFLAKVYTGTTNTRARAAAGDFMALIQEHALAQHLNPLTGEPTKGWKWLPDGFAVVPEHFTIIDDPILGPDNRTPDEREKMRVWFQNTFDTRHLDTGRTICVPITRHP